MLAFLSLLAALLLCRFCYCWHVSGVFTADAEILVLASQLLLTSLLLMTSLLPMMSLLCWLYRIYLRLLKVVTNEKGGAVGDVLTITC